MSVCLSVCLSRQTDRQTDMLITIFGSPTKGQLIILCNNNNYNTADEGNQRISDIIRHHSSVSPHNNTNTVDTIELSRNSQRMNDDPIRSS